MTFSYNRKSQLGKVILTATEKKTLKFKKKNVRHRDLNPREWDGDNVSLGSLWSPPPFKGLLNVLFSFFIE